jgi:hypothetical protein
MLSIYHHPVTKTFAKTLVWYCDGLECGVPVQLKAVVEQKAFGGYRLVR